MATEVRHGTLVADVVTTVTFTEDHERVEVLNRNGVAAVYFRFDGVDPTVAGNDCLVAPAAIGGVLHEVESGGATEVRLISSGAVDFSVTAGRL